MLDHLFELLIQANLCLLALGVFYALFLSKLSFQSGKRAFVLMTMIISGIIPMLEIEMSIMTPLPETALTLSEMFAPIEPGTIEETPAQGISVTSIISLSTVLTSISFLLLTIGLLRFAWFAIRWFLLRRKLDRSSYFDDSYGAHITDEFSMPFAFNGNVYIPLSALGKNTDDLTQIIAHEKRHTELKHGLDKWIIHLAGVVFWINPIYHYLSKDQSATHEYEADQQFIGDMTRTSYSELLLTLSEQPQSIPSIVSPFSRSLIENRVRRLNQPKSNAMKKGMFLLSAPIVLLLVYAFSINFEKDFVHPQTSSVSQFFSSPIDLTQVKSYSSFGMRVEPKTQNPKMHTGIDLAAKEGTEIYASADGTVTLLEVSDQGHGNRIGISHNDGFESRYSHLKEILVENGQEVQSGQLIGMCGSTGRSFGPHLHFEILHNDSQVNPEDFLTIQMEDFSGEAIDRDNFIVLIDPGHGGKDPGVTTEQVNEKELTLEYALELSEQLKVLGISSVLLRDSDVDLALRDRTSAGNSNKETLYLSLHFNESQTDDAQGIEIYVAEKEDLNQLKSKVFARKLGAELSNNAIMNRGLRTANFFVLKESRCPTVLLELGFLSSSPDLERILSEDYKKRLCSTIAQSVNLYAN